MYYFIYSLWKTDLDIGEDWVDSEDESELGDYATEKLPAEIVNRAERKQSQTVRIIPDQRKTSTGSQVYFIYCWTILNYLSVYSSIV